MSVNSFGRVLRFTTWGESHGPALGAVVDGCPPRIALSEDDIQPFLDARRPGTSRFTTQRREPDEVRILSGVFEGPDGIQRTTGTPISLMIENTDQRSKDYSEIAKSYRPGHADYAYDAKYGLRDYRGGGRSSARETAMRVAAAGIAKKYLRETYGVNIFGGLVGIGELAAHNFDWSEVANNDFFCPDASLVPAIAELIDALRREGDSIGAEIAVVAEGVPAGWGEPVFAKLDADIAGALMGINAVKGVALGDGFDVVAQRGSQHRDEMNKDGFLSNHAGGILGGISSGQSIMARLALKPTSSLTIPGKSIDKSGNEVEVVTKGRHDPCVGIRATPIAEAMLALVLMDHAMRQRAQNPTQSGSQANN